MKVGSSRSTKFGVILLPYSVSFSTILKAAKRAEELGFDSVWVSDHIQRGKIPTLECWSTISALGARTESLRIGSLATCSSFRNPALLAKTFSTASNISNGRVELGIGTGYDPDEHIANGYDFPILATRIDRLCEILQILQILWNKGEPIDFHGRFFHLKNAVSEPKPVAEPRVTVAGRNRELIESVSGLADAVNILPYSGTLEKRRISTVEEIEELSDFIGSFGLERSMYCGDGGVIIGKDAREVEERIKALSALQGSDSSEIEKRLANLSIIHGTVEKCREAISTLESLGFSELMMIFPGWQQEDFANMDLFAKEFL